MALSTHEQTRIREYLLGHLSDEEQEKIEERLIADDDFFEELEISKGELIEDYCGGELTEKERQWFERHYLMSKEGRERHALAVAITCLNRTAAQQDASWFKRLQSFLQPHTWAVAVTTAGAVLIIALGVWFSRSDSRTIVSFALTSTAAKRGQSGSEIYRLKLNRNVAEVRISLALPNVIAAGATYRAELDDGRNTKAVHVIGQEGNMILVSLSAADVPTGYYALRVFSTEPGATEQQLPGDYRFIVE